MAHAGCRRFCGRRGSAGSRAWRRCGGCSPAARRSPWRLRWSPGCPTFTRPDHAGLLAGAGTGSWSAMAAVTMPLFGHLFGLRRHSTAFRFAPATPWGAPPGNARSPQIRRRDSKDHDQIKEMSLDAVEFIRRFPLRVLPGGFVKIRHFGFLSNRNRRAMVKRCRELPPPWTAPPDIVERYEAVCPVCGAGHLHVIESRPAERLRPTATPRQTPPLDTS